MRDMSIATEAVLPLVPSDEDVRLIASLPQAARAKAEKTRAVQARRGEEGMGAA